MSAPASAHQRPPPPPENGFIKSVGFAEDMNPKWRRTMEDAHVTINEFGSKDQSFYAVYDGHGGREAVDFVAKHFHTNLLTLLHGKNTKEEVLSAIDEAYSVTDDQIKSENILYNGTTAVSLFIKHFHNGRPVIFASNAGDARSILSRNGRAERLTFDHKPSETSESQRVRDAGGFVAYNRVNGILSVSRALGDHAMKPFVISKPYTNAVEMNRNDDFAILACDGVWDVISDQEAIDLVKNIEDAQRAAEKIVEHALKNGSTDNISVLVVRFRFQ